MKDLYCWNQPKKHGTYDLILNGKIKADEFIYYVKNDESGDYESISLTNKINDIEERLATHFSFNTDYATYEAIKLAFENGELKETVIYVVGNDDKSDNPKEKDNFNEYMVVSYIENEETKKKLELIGSGSFEKQQIDLELESSKRETADTALGKRIDDEASTRKSADDVLGKSIDDEAKVRNEKDTELDGKISNEITNRTNADNSLGERIDNEITDRTKADDVLSERIKTIENFNINNRVNKIEIDLPDEILRASAAENELDKKISQEISDREALQEEVTALKSLVDTLKIRIDILEGQNNGDDIETNNISSIN